MPLERRETQNVNGVRLTKVPKGRVSGRRHHRRRSEGVPSALPGYRAEEQFEATPPGKKSKAAIRFTGLVAHYRLTNRKRS